MIKHIVTHFGAKVGVRIGVTNGIGHFYLGHNRVNEHNTYDDKGRPKECIR